MTTGRVERALLLARTIRHLDPSQVVHRMRLRGQKAAMAMAPGLVAPRLQRAVPAEVGWPDGYLPLDGRLSEGCPSAEANSAGRFRFLAHERSLGEPPVEWQRADWEQDAAEQLWRYHLHYFEWAWPFASHPDRAWARETFAQLWQSWASGTTFGRWDAWSPYVVSLRSWVWCGIYRPLIAGGPHDEAFRTALGLHAGFVRANLEFDVGGNHLVKNLKALVGLGVFLGDERLVSVATGHLERQIVVQVLSDGGHFELSPSYHCQVLADLIDVGALLEAGGRPPVAGLQEAVSAMRRWLGVMVLPDGDVPMFNDCALVGHHRLMLLEPIPATARRLVVLQPSGYVVMRPDDRIHLIADVGAPCPPQLPAHAHADCLSFELAVDGRRTIVNSGTSTYQPGKRRAYERSTAAHNTVQVDGQDQTEVWGAFRAARRARPSLDRSLDDGQVIEVVGSHDGYRRLVGRPRHRRTWRVAAGSIGITDEIVGRGSHQAVSTLHVAPGLPVEETAGGLLIEPLVVTAAPGQASRRVETEDSEVATGFGLRSASTTLRITMQGEAPLRQELRLSVADDGGRARRGATRVEEGQPSE